MNKKILVICTSVFQMYLAKKIILNNMDNEYYIIYIGTISKKSKHYFKDISSLCKKSYNFENNIFSLLYLKFNFFEVDKLLVASIDSDLAHMYLDKFPSMVVETFDDGLLNILPDSFYYNNQNINFKKRVKRKILGIETKTEDIRRKSILHYTVYKNEQNIVSKLNYISLGLNSRNYNYNKMKKILVGQPIFDNKIKKMLLLSKKVKEKIIDIDYWYPHPREKYKLDDYICINSEYILEEYIEKNSDTFFEVYTFFSSSVLNLKDFENVIIKSLYSKDIPDKYLSAYNLLSKYNIEIINIDN